MFVAGFVISRAMRIEGERRWLTPALAFHGLHQQRLDVCQQRVRVQIGNAIDVSDPPVSVDQEDPQDMRELVENLQDAGGVLTGGQALGSPALLTAESALETAIGGGPLKGLREANQKLLTRKAAESIGLEDVDELSGVVLGNAGKAIGREMTDIAEGVGEMTVPRGFAGRIRNLDDPTIVLEDKTVRMIEQMAKQFDAIIKKGGTIDAQTYSTVRQNLTKNVRGFSGADGTLNDLEVTSAAIEALDSVLRGSLPPGQGNAILEQLASARERYRNYIALSRGNTVGSDGVVSPALLANSLSQVYGNTFKQGAQAVRNVPTAELFDLATGLSTRRMKPALGSSGTAERNQMLAGAAQLGPAIMGIASGDLSTAAIAASPLVVPGLISLGARAGPLSDLGGAIQTAVTTGSGNLLNQ